MHDLTGKKIAILATNGFEQSELLEPKRRLSEAGATVHVVSPESGEIRAWDKTDWGESVKVDKTVDVVEASDYDALVLPGGQINPDTLRLNQAAIRLVLNFHETDKPIGAICHAPWLLIEADLVSGRRMTSWPSLRKDMENAGAEWVDEEVVFTDGIVTSRKPADLDAFCRKLAEVIAKEKVEGRIAS